MKFLIYPLDFFRCGYYIQFYEYMHHTSWLVLNLRAIHKVCQAKIWVWGLRDRWGGYRVVLCHARIFSFSSNFYRNFHNFIEFFQKFLTLRQYDNFIKYGNFLNLTQYFMETTLKILGYQNICIWFHTKSKILWHSFQSHFPQISQLRTTAHHECHFF